MKKRIFSLLLALCLLSGNCLTVFADETEPASQESTAEAMTTETQEQTQPQPILEEPAPIQPETQPQSPVSPQTEPTAPVLTPDSLSIDMDRQYPGMDKTYRAGYSGTVSDGKLRLVLPLLNQSDLSTPINVTLSAAFLTAEEKKACLYADKQPALPHQRQIPCAGGAFLPAHSCDFDDLYPSHRR